MRALALVAGLAAGSAEAACRQALVLALDVSGSVDEIEYDQQMTGLAAALDSEAVRQALLAFPGAPVSLTVFEWSSSQYQQEVLGWTALGGPEDVDRVVAHLRRWQRRVAPDATAIGAAMTHAEELFESGPDCWASTLDISGDGKNNDWPIPARLREDGVLSRVTINALVIGPDRTVRGDERGVGIAELSAYYATEIIQGADAFVETALGYEGYADAMERKLLKELTVLTLGRLGASNQ